MEKDILYWLWLLAGIWGIYRLSPASLMAYCSNSADNLKFVCLIFCNNGFIEGITPFSFALMITPI
jgi:hypothetical protein